MHSIQFLECTGSSAESGKLTNFSKGTALMSPKAKFVTSIENSMIKENFILKSATPEVHGKEKVSFANNIPTKQDLLRTILDNEDHALATIPTGFSVRQSTIPNAGLGVYAETTIPNGTRLGPYDGTLSKESDGDELSYIFTVVYRNGKTKHNIDAKGKETSSWLRYINCARTIDEENLDVYQYNYEIYYVTNQCIKPGRELLVWYGDSYGESLGLERTSDDDDYAELSGRTIIVDTMDTIKG
ncbi:PRDM7_9 [Mytilus edulis]|uniref:PRDM7_9 n=1 Tax=Mytilus edulis TaxID=6550 RepID=A0A8S3QXQ8_MYTED|nr:PRDM7_9 [Mytilus edulis]